MSRRPENWSPPQLIWLVTFRDVKNPGDYRRPMAAFTTQDEAVRLLQHLERVGDLPDLMVMALDLHQRFDDWQYDPELDEE
jgi:hypothetical protein